MTVEELVGCQREYYAGGETRALDRRQWALETLQSGLRRHEERLNRALYADLGKAPLETYMTEVGIVSEELSHIRRRLRGWVRPQKVRTPLVHFRARSRREPEPYGVALVIAPWNYPVQLSLAPLAGALAAGNCAVLKPSAYAPNTSHALAELIADCFPPEYVAVVEGGRAENTALLEQRWDYIFFTGSVQVGKLVMKKAAEHLTPVTLELGGKSPCIVDRTADLDVAARRLVFGKVLNAGQTCVAPDYLLVDEVVREAFLPKVVRAIEENFPNGDYGELPRIVNEKHFDRLQGLMGSGKLYYGGGADREARLIPPTILTEVGPEEPVMGEEIFGPILPVLSYTRLDEALAFIRERPKPLALYLFTGDRAVERRVLDSVSFGGGCINDTIVHLATSHMPFGGVGESGMGSYHGRQSFDTFSHYRSILKKANWPDLPMRNHPYTKGNLALIRKLMK